MRLAIITGASSGLGREFALQITKKYPDEFDEMWLIARRREQLEELSAQVDALAAQSGARVAAKPVPLDLTQAEDLDRFEEMIAEAAAAAEHTVQCPRLPQLPGNPCEYGNSPQRPRQPPVCRTPSPAQPAWRGAPGSH